MKEELLEYVFSHVQENCLSDLRVPSVLRKHLDLILEINEEQFDLNDWNGLLRYICETSMKTESIAQAKEALQTWTKEK